MIGRYDDIFVKCAVSIVVGKKFCIDDDADLILTEKDLFVDHLFVRSNTDNERVRISTDEIIVIECFGHDIVIHSAQGEFKTSERLYQLD